MDSNYLPNAQSFSSGLPVGKSNMPGIKAKGRTVRERVKQQKRAVRVRERSAKAAAKK
jgi:hypothetical protein